VRGRFRDFTKGGGTVGPKKTIWGEIRRNEKSPEKHGYTRAWEGRGRRMRVQGIC